MKAYFVVLSIATTDKRVCSEISEKLKTIIGGYEKTKGDYTTGLNIWGIDGEMDAEGLQKGIVPATIIIIDNEIRKNSR